MTRAKYWDGSAWVYIAPGPKGDTGPAGAVIGQTLFFDNTASDLLTPTITGTVFAAVNSNPDTITRSSGSFVTDGFQAGQKISMSGWANAGNNAKFTIAIVAADTLTLITSNALTAEAAGATVTISRDRERISRAPAAGTEQDESVSVVAADGDVTVDDYCTVSGYPGTLAILAGVWTFHAWAWVSSTTGTPVIKFKVLKVAADGTETVLFTTANTAVTATSLGAAQEISPTYVIPADIPLLTTDRIAVRVAFSQSSGVARTCHFVYQGSSRASHVDTTLVVSGVSLPTGGATGTALMKKSAADYDAEFRAIAQADVTDLAADLDAKTNLSLTTAFDGAAFVRENMMRIMNTSAIAGVTSGRLYLMAVPVQAGDVISNITFSSATTALTMGSNLDGHLWFALYDLSGNLLGQTADEGGAATWATSTNKTLALTSPYTVTADGCLYAAYMINSGTGGSPVQPTLRGVTNTGAIIVGAVSGQVLLGAAGATSLTDTAPATTTLTATSVILYAALS